MTGVADGRSDAVTVRLGTTVETGRALDLTERGLDPERVAAAVRGEEAVTAERGDSDPLAVDCPDPGPAHEHVGCLRPSTSLRTRTALAAAARSRGLDAPEDDRITTVADRLADLDVPSPPDLREARERLAGTERAVEEGRERVATLRGRVQAAREAGRDASDVAAELRAAQRELSEHETERAAAREALERARSAARESRDARERRRRLEDRLGNLRRAARTSLVAAVREEFASAVAAAPGGEEAEVRSGEGDPPADPFAVDDLTAALAVARVATLRAPVVLAVDRFDSPAAAAEWLEAPVVRV